MYLVHWKENSNETIVSVDDKRTQYIIDSQNQKNGAYIKTIVLLIKAQNCADIQWIILIVQSVINQTLYQSIEHWKLEFNSWNHHGIIWWRLH